MPPTTRALAILLLVGSLGACVAPTSSDSSRVFPFDTAASRRITTEALLDRLSEADVVFLGETHLDEETHRFEHTVYEGLIDRTAGRVVLAMEMFERDVQPVLDDYLAGRIDEATFLSKARPWGNYRTAYRRLIETARRHGLPVVAANAPRPLIRKIGGTQEGFDALSPEERSLFPDEIHDNSPEYWRRVDNAIRGHAAMMGGSGAGGGDRRFSTQALWDNSMGDACARALADHPGWVVLHVNGGFHSSRHLGTVGQLRRRAPDSRIATIDIDARTNPGVIDGSRRDDADFVVYVESRARDIDNGMYGVALSHELRYRLHVPRGADDDAPVPLLVWLGDDDRTPNDGLALWKRRLGDACAIAVPELLWPGEADDLVAGGRWFRDGSFMGDISKAARAVEDLVGYVTRNLPVDADRVVIAGEGSGATIAIAGALFADAVPARAIAVSPRAARKFADFSLPLRDVDGEKTTAGESIDVLTDDDWWDDELAQYEAVGIATSRAIGEDDPWTREAALEARLRDRLGLSETDRTSAEPAHVVLPLETPRARAWARLAALALADERGGPVAVLGPDDAPPAGSTPIALEVTPKVFSKPGRLPRASGPFGGTTVVVVPEGTSVSDWIALEDDDPLQAHSRFHRLRVATIGGPERPLDDILATLRAERRRNVLIVPAVFCAAPAMMRRLRDAAGHEAQTEMTLQFVPGLGDRLVEARTR